MIRIINVCTVLLFGRLDNCVLSNFLRTEDMSGWKPHVFGPEKTSTWPHIKHKGEQLVPSRRGNDQR